MPESAPISEIFSIDNPVFRAAGISAKPKTISPKAPALPVNKTPVSTENSAALSEIASIDSAASPENSVSLDQITNVDSFPRRTPEELSADKTFNPTQYYAQNPDVAKDPAQLAKLLEAYRTKREAGITPAVVGEALKQAYPTGKKFAKGVYQLASNLFQLTGLQTAANELLGATETPQVREELRKESFRNIAAAPVEIAAGTETAATGLADLARTGIRKLAANPVLGGTPVKEKSDQELLQDLNSDVAFQKQLAEVGRGGGEALKSVGLDADNLAKVGIKLEPDVIENLSLVDPVTMIAFAGGFKLLGAGGKLLATVPTVAKGAELVEKLGTAIPKLIGGSVKLAGKTVPTTAATGAIVGGVAHGGPFGLLTGILAAERIAPRVAKIGAGIENLGEQIAGNAPRSATLQTIIDAAKSPLVTSPIKGAVAGTAAAIPLAAAAEGNEQAGAILGGGLALGTVAGAVHGGTAQLGEFAANRLFDPHSVKFAPIDSPGYGTDPVLDAANAKQLSKLSVNERGTLTTFREAFRPLGAEIYSVEGPTYVDAIVNTISRQEGRPATPAEITEAQKQAQSQGYFDYNRADGRRVVLLNGNLGAVLHEPGHLFDSLLSPEKKAEIVAAIKDNYSPEQISALKAQYEQRLGKPVADQYFLNELIAENFSAIFNNVPVTELTAPPGFLRKLAAVVGEGAEALGINLAKGKQTPALGAPVSFGLHKIFENAAREVTETQAAPGLPTPGAPAAVPTTPTPAKPTPIPPGTTPARPAPTAAPLITPSVSAAPNIRVTRGQQDAFARRAAETGVDTAKALAEKTGDAELTQRVNEVSNFMQSGNPVLEIEHRGVIAEGTPEAPSGRTSRRAEQEAAYIQEGLGEAPELVRNRHQKTFVPVRWETVAGKPQLIAMSLDKVIANVSRAVKDIVAAKQEVRIPYDVDTTTGKLTDTGWENAIRDLQAYTENQSNGFRGDGQRLIRPATDIGVSIPAENPDYRPTILPEDKTNFLNLIQGLKLPFTARIEKGRVPGNIKAQEIAKAQGRQPQTPAVIRPKDIGKQTFPTGETIQETNPLRNELRAAGVDTSELIEVTERISAEDIQNVTPRPELNFKAPVTDIIRGGFLPSNKENFDGYVNQVADADANQFRELAKQWGGGFTTEAWKVGREVTIPEQVATLKRLQTEQETAARTALSRGDFEAATPASFKSQFFREAWEAATGEGSAGNALRQREPRYEPPFPAGEQTRAFLPRTAKGTELSKEGFDFRISGKPGSRILTTFKDDKRIGVIRTESAGKDSITITSSDLKPTERGKGLGEAAYRELLTQLKDDGVKEVGGNIVAPEPLAIRRKVFGGEFKKLEKNLEPVSIDDALASLNELRRGSKDLIHVEAVNEIRPESQFLPNSEDLSPSELKYKEAEEYFSIGHPSDEEGEPPTHSSIWAWLDGKIQVDSADKTHGIVWGHNKTDKTFKGRYDADTDTLSFVTPVGSKVTTPEEIPNQVYSRLKDNFGEDFTLKFFGPDGVETRTSGAFLPAEFPDISKDIKTDSDYAYHGGFLPQIKIPGDEEIASALSADKKNLVGAARDLNAGHPVGLRIDIPAYNRTGKYVITVHESAKGGQVGKRIGYDSIATVDNPVFFSNERGAEKIRGGAPKFPIATVEGNYNPSREIPPDLTDWTEVGFNPIRHSYFYDKVTDEPVVSGTKAVSVGNSVFVKNAKFGSREDFAFLPAEEQTFKGFEEPSPEKKAKLYIARRRARATENTPEALPPKYARDEDGNPVDTDGKN